MMFAARMDARIGGWVGTVRLTPLYEWSNTPRHHAAWRVAESVIWNMIKTSRVHSITDANYHGPVTREVLGEEWGKLLDNRELAQAYKHDFVIQYSFFVRVGSYDMKHPAELLNIGYYHK